MMNHESIISYFIIKNTLKPKHQHLRQFILNVSKMTSMPHYFRIIYLETVSLSHYDECSIQMSKNLIDLNGRKGSKWQCCRRVINWRTLLCEKAELHECRPDIFEIDLSWHLEEFYRIMCTCYNIMQTTIHLYCLKLLK